MPRTSHHATHGMPMRIGKATFSSTTGFATGVSSCKCRIFNALCVLKDIAKGFRNVDQVEAEVCILHTASASTFGAMYGSSPHVETTSTGTLNNSASRLACIVSSMHMCRNYTIECAASATASREFFSRFQPRKTRKPHSRCAVGATETTSVLQQDGEDNKNRA